MAPQPAFGLCIFGCRFKFTGVVPAVTFAATVNAFCNLGAKVIFCDVNPDDGIINLDSLEVLLKTQTKQ